MGRAWSCCAGDGRAPAAHGLPALPPQRQVGLEAARLSGPSPLLIPLLQGVSSESP